LSKILSELTSFVGSYAADHPGCSKAKIAEATASHFGLQKTRSVYHRPEFAIRFSTAKGQSFSNVILSLSALQNYDRSPFIVCVVRPKSTELLLANTTFLKKISHSSHQLQVDKIRGSFLGHDILRKYDDIENSSENFDILFEIHRQFSWEDNLARLVERTNAIAPTGARFIPSEEQEQKILESPKLAKRLSKHSEYLKLYDELDGLVRGEKCEILKAAQIDNINLRGNTIEQIITKAGNFHNLEDISWTLVLGPEIKIDIKTKILAMASSPKAYNIDKVLKELAKGNIVFSFFFIGIDVEDSNLKTCLVSIFDTTVLKSTRVQFHWAGRNSRGVTQLTGDFLTIFNPDFSETIDVSSAQRFLKELIDLKTPGKIDCF